jgi:hypothetical protein
MSKAADFGFLPPGGGFGSVNKRDLQGKAPTPKVRRRLRGLSITSPNPGRPAFKGLDTAAIRSLRQAPEERHVYSQPASQT